MSKFRTPRITVVLGVPLALVGTLVGGLFASSWFKKHTPPAQEPPSTPSTPASDPQTNVVTFLMAAADEWDTANQDCFLAERCGDVEASPHRGSVGSESEIAACFDAKIPPCAAAVAALEALQAPSELQEVWPQLVRRRAAMPLELARKLQTTWAVLTAKPRLRAANRDYGSLVDWAIRNDPSFKAFHNAQASEDARLHAAFEALDKWTRDQQLCFEGQRCTFEKVMSGKPLVARRFWSLDARNRQ